MTIDDKQPPADLEAERQVLGAMLYDRRHVDALPASFTADTFYSRAHAVVFEIACELRKARTDINPTTVGAMLRKRQRVGELPGGESFLEEIVDGTPAMAASTFDLLAKTVQDKATMRAALHVMHEAMATVYATDVDPSEFLANLGKNVLALSQSAHAGSLVAFKSALDEELSSWHDRAAGKAPTPGIATGFDRFDRQTGGWHRGELAIVAARPGMGKTSFVTACAVNVAKRNYSTAIFSLEMPSRQLAARVLCTEAAIQLMSARKGEFSSEELTRANVHIGQLRDLDIYVSDLSQGRPTIADIATRTRKLAADLAARKRRLGLLVVDYVQIVKLREVLLKQRHELAVGEVSTELKALATELNIAVIGVAQLNRGVEQRQDKRPGMADLRDSGQLEQDADIIVMLYRDEYYNPGTNEPGVVEAIIEKQRNGPTGTVKLKFDGPTTKFSNLADGDFYE